MPTLLEQIRLAKAKIEKVALPESAADFIPQNGPVAPESVPAKPTYWQKWLQVHANPKVSDVKPANAVEMTENKAPIGELTFIQKYYQAFVQAKKPAILVEPSEKAQGTETQNEMPSGELTFLQKIYQLFAALKIAEKSPESAVKSQNTEAQEASINEAPVEERSVEESKAAPQEKVFEQSLTTEETVSPFLAAIRAKKEALRDVAPAPAKPVEPIEPIFAALQEQVNKKLPEPKLPSEDDSDQNNEWQAEQHEQANAIKIENAVDEMLGNQQCVALVDNIVSTAKEANTALIEQVVQHYDARLRADLKLSTLELDDAQGIDVHNAIVDAQDRVSYAVVDNLNTHAYVKARGILKALMADKLTQLTMTDEMTDLELSQAITKELSNQALIKATTDAVHHDIFAILNNENKFLDHQLASYQMNAGFCKQNVAMLEGKLATDVGLMKQVLTDLGVNMPDGNNAVVPVKANPHALDTDLAKQLADRRKLLTDSGDDWDDVIDTGKNNIPGLGDPKSCVDSHVAHAATHEVAGHVVPATVEAHVDAPALQVPLFG